MEINIIPHSRSHIIWGPLMGVTKKEKGYFSFLDVRAKTMGTLPETASQLSTKSVSPSSDIFVVRWAYVTKL